MKETAPSFTAYRITARDIVLTALLVVGAAIVAFVPPFFPFAHASVYPPAVRVLLMLVFGVAGLYCARCCGLEIMPHGLRHPMWVSLIVGVLVAAYLLLLDAVFRAQLTGNAAESLLGISLWVRLIYYVLRSVNEGIVYQLFFGSVFVFLIGRVWRHDGAIAPGAYWLGLILAHALNLAINVPFHASTFIYDTLRFFAPGILWVYLYRRYGLSVAVAAHAATHVFFQPFIALTST
ncbi:hypothetical protein [Paraburkholderia agricolaris]|uniref:hypothetical protein n=1 Tax=Paraburkholderia agricolaris TaxID=2152888 RepID=UPI0012926C32|nr:hypothetical protein [Paraburkholderia agricolaris]